MTPFRRAAVAAVAALLLGLSGSPALAQASSCSASVSAKVPAPSVAPGYEARLVASNLIAPRGLVFDTAGNLLVVNQLAGITAITFDDAGGSCLSEARRRVVSNDTTLNHGIAIDPSGRTLYASSTDSVFSYPYDPQAARLLANGSVVVSNMTTDDHTTRTLLLSRKVNGTLVVTRGSTSNIDPLAAQISSGHSQIKAFDLNTTHAMPYDFDSAGKLLGWGMRNDVGIAEEPTMGGLYSVENSADNVMRDNVDVHQNNPAEKLNFLGWLQPPPGVAQSTNQGANFGYPQCFAAWQPSEIPDFSGQTGSQFAIGTLNQTNNDTYCQDAFVAPRLSFLAHMAPLDIKFNSNGSTAWVTFHGSWDRTQPSGYKVSALNFRAGQPTANRSSTTALVDVVANQDNSKCPNDCFRPVAMAWDSQGRLFFSSDATGEIYVVTKAGASGTAAGVDSSSPAAASSASASASPAPASSSTTSASSHASSSSSPSLIGTGLFFLLAVAAQAL